MTTPGQLAARDQADAACREVRARLAAEATAAGRAVHYEPPALKAWINDITLATIHVRAGGATRSRS